MVQPIAKIITSDHAESQMFRRGITTDQLLEVLANRYVISRNRKQRSASHIILGHDNSGRCLAVPVVPTGDPLVWRALTAWPCKPSEAAKLR